MASPHAWGGRVRASWEAPPRPAITIYRPADGDVDVDRFLAELRALGRNVIVIQLREHQSAVTSR